MRSRLSGSINGPLVGALQPICMGSSSVDCVMKSDSTRCGVKRQRGVVQDMDFGLHIGTRGCRTTRDNIMAMANSAEAGGYAIVGVADHLIVPVRTDVRYPYSTTGEWPG